MSIIDTIQNVINDYYNQYGDVTKEIIADIIENNLAIINGPDVLEFDNPKGGTFVIEWYQDCINDVEQYYTDDEFDISDESNSFEYPVVPYMADKFYVYAFE